jgi:hypothetical protein
MSLFDDIKNKISQLSKTVSNSISSDSKVKLQEGFEKTKSDFRQIVGEAAKLIDQAEVSIREQLEKTQRYFEADKAQTQQDLESIKKTVQENIQSTHDVLNQLQQELSDFTSKNSNKIAAYIDKKKADWSHELAETNQKIDEAKASLNKTIEQIKHTNTVEEIRSTMSKVKNKADTLLKEVKSDTENIMSVTKKNINDVGKEASHTAKSVDEEISSLDQ